jgi:hypothetical protein
MSAFGGIKDIALTFRYVGFWPKPTFRRSLKSIRQLRLRWAFYRCAALIDWTKADSRSSRHKVDAPLERRTMNPAISQLEAFITRLDRRRADIELSLMDRTRPAQEQEQLKQTYDLLFELRQIAATSLTIVQRQERELARLNEQASMVKKPHSGT